MCEFVSAWDELKALERWRDIADVAPAPGIGDWFAYWSPAASRWWTDDPDSLAATGFSCEEDFAQLAWLVPQTGADVLLVVSGSDGQSGRTGPTKSERQAEWTGFDAVFGPGRSIPGDSLRDIHALVPWLTGLSERMLAHEDSIPGCERHGFNVRAIHVQNEERDEWLCYEVYPVSETTERQNILAVIETKPTVVFVRPQAG